LTLRNFTGVGLPPEAKGRALGLPPSQAGSYNHSNMKLLDDVTIEASSEACAVTVMDTALLVVRLIRAEIRRVRPGALSLNQVRALGLVGTYPHSSLSNLSELLGLTLPSASHLVDGLVGRGLVARRTAPDDRRQIMLKLTPQGERLLAQAQTITRKHLAERLAPLNSAQRALITESMKLLRPLVTASPRAGAAT